MQILYHCEKFTQNYFACIQMFSNLTLKFCFVINIYKIVYQSFSLPI